MVVVLMSWDDPLCQYCCIHGGGGDAGRLEEPGV